MALILKKKQNINIFFGLLILIILFHTLFIVGLNNLDLLINPKLVTPLSPLYYIKRLRENNQNLFVFGEIDHVLRDLTLAEKRIVEVEILSSRNKPKILDRQKKLALSHLNSAKSGIDNLAKSEDVNYMNSKLKELEERILSID